MNRTYGAALLTAIIGVFARALLYEHQIRATDNTVSRLKSAPAPIDESPVSDIQWLINEGTNVNAKGGYQSRHSP